MDADIKVGIVAFKIVTGAIEKGSVQELKDLKVERTDRGGCIDGVNISLVRTISRGARTIPAIPAAEMTTAREVRGEGDERISSPPAYVDGGES